MLLKSLLPVSSVTLPVPAATVVAPAVTVMTLAAVCVMLLFVEFRLSVPVAVTLSLRETPVAPVRLTLLPVKSFEVVKVVPLLRVRSAVPVLMTVAGSVSNPPATNETAEFAALVSVVTLSAPALRKLMAPPVAATLPNALVAVASVMLPVPAVRVDAPVMASAADCAKFPLLVVTLSAPLAVTNPSVTSPLETTFTLPPPGPVSITEVGVIDTVLAFAPGVPNPCPSVPALRVTFSVPTPPRIFAPAAKTMLPWA